MEITQFFLDEIVRQGHMSEEIKDDVLQMLKIVGRDEFRNGVRAGIVAERNKQITQ